MFAGCPSYQCPMHEEHEVKKEVTLTIAQSSSLSAARLIRCGLGSYVGSGPLRRLPVAVGGAG